MEKNQEKRYIGRKERYQRLQAKYKKTNQFIVNLRFLIFVLGFITLFLLFRNQYFILFTLSLMFFLWVFTYLVIKHIKIARLQQYVTFLREINMQSLERIRGNWHSFSDTGEEFLKEEHPYSMDLDIFGKGSLFQWINCTTTYMGRIHLKEFLESPLKNRKDIKERQKSIKELEGSLSWRQRLMAEGMEAAQRHIHPAPLMEWAEKEIPFYRKKAMERVVFFLPIITILLGIGALMTPKIPYYLPLISLVMQALLLLWGSKERNTLLGRVSRYKRNVKAYQYMLQTIERKKFKSPYLKELQFHLKGYKETTASKEMERLSKILEGVSNGFNIFYLILNLFTLLDYHRMIALEKWKKKYGKEVKKWLDTLGEIEALSSLAIIGGDNPNWVMPEIVEGGPVISARNMAHPLLGEDRVANDISIKDPTPVLLITGSNMSGKSTLLRTVGINLVLAYRGVSVCAQAFQCSIMNIYSCMRVRDSLENNTSSFYAELLRIKEILMTAREGQPLFFLLDEIFKGTNSQDRHMGAKTLIGELSKYKTLGLVSTHDLELSDLEEERQGKVKNYHFQEYYVNNEIKFDYVLREGVSTTRNALYLMKMIGLDIQE